MPLTLQTAPGGSNFNGSPGLGAVFFTDLSPTNDTERAEIFSIGMQNIVDVKTSIWVRLAEDLGKANDGPFLELANVENTTGVTLACCHCIVPRGWSLFVNVSGPATVDSHLSVDWRRVTLETTA